MSQPRPSNARPTRRASSASTAPRGQARAVQSKAKSKPRLDPNDAGVKRRAAKRKVRRRNNLVAWSLLVVATVIVAGAATGIWQEYQSVQQKVGAKEATLSDLRAQLERKQRRVQALAKREGKERALVEGGYLGEGERFLLFPKSKDKAARE